MQTMGSAPARIGVTTQVSAPKKPAGIIAARRQGVRKRRGVRHTAR